MNMNRFTRRMSLSMRPRVSINRMMKFRSFGTVPSSQILNRLESGHGIETISSTSSLQSAASRMISNNTSYLMVIAENDHIIGFVTERDCIRAITKGADGVSDVTMSDLMTPMERIVTVQEGVPSEDLFKIMLTNNIRHLPICDDHFVLRKVVSIKDVAKNIVVDSME